jgi:hypothetical protein
LNFQAAAEIGLRGGPEEIMESGEEDEEPGADHNSHEEHTASVDSDLEESAEVEQLSLNDTSVPREEPSAELCDSPREDTQGAGSSEDDADEYLDVMANVEFRPFQDERSRQHVNCHLTDGRAVRQRSSDSFTSTASTIDPRVVRHKVKSQMKQKQARRNARRIRKSGEAALVTKKRRDNMDAIKHNTGWD